MEEGVERADGGARTCRRMGAWGADMLLLLLPLAVVRCGGDSSGSRWTVRLAMGASQGRRGVGGSGLDRRPRMCLCLCRAGVVAEPLNDGSRDVAGQECSTKKTADRRGSDVEHRG